MIGALFLEKQVPDCRYTHRKNRAKCKKKKCFPWYKIWL